MAEISLAGGLVALVDDEDSYLAKYKWSVLKVRNKRYVFRRERVDGQVRYLYLHREVLGLVDSTKVDHVDDDGLNCRRGNLRPATNAQNLHNRGPQKNNTSGFKGVCFFKPAKKWRAEIQANGERRSLGYFSTPEAAAHAYDEAAKKLHGPFAKLNFK